ncbi:MAG: hypothetical protein Q9187_003340 [Circinaria calcarea]
MSALRSVFQSFAYLSLLSPIHSWEYNFPEQWQSQWPENWQTSLGMDQSCTTNHLTAFAMAKPGEPVFVSTSPLDDFEAPKVLPLNSTVGEQWEFDGVSEDGMLSFIFGLYRDPGLAIMGSGNLRVSAELAYANGTRFGRVDYPSDSIVEQCQQGTRGVWKSNALSYTFEVSKDMNRVRIGVDTPDLKGNILMNSRTLPRYADASTWPASNATTSISPYFHWVEPVPVGDVKVDLMVKGEKFRFSGLGGHARIWSPFNWYTCLKAMNAVRLMAGPYSLSYMKFTSKLGGGSEYPSVLLMKDGEKVFSSTKGEVSDTEDYVLLTKTYDGQVTGTLRDKVTGYELELVSPRMRKHWTFIAEHKNVAFEYILGGGRGGSGFSSSSSGGPVGLEQFRGVALTEALNFPDKSPLFKAQYVE